MKNIKYLVKLKIMNVLFVICTVSMNNIINILIYI